MLPALNHAAVVINSTESPKQQDIKSIVPPTLKKTANLAANTNPALCVAPYLKKILDLKSIQIFMLNDCPETTNTLPGDVTTSTTVGNGSEKLEEDQGGGSTSEKLEEDGGTTVGTSADASETKAEDAGEAGEYDPHAIFGADSKVFTRIMHPVKNLFADVALALTKITHNNQQYNLIPILPDPMIDVNAINAYLEIPFTEKMDFKVSVGRDALTSASPIFYTVTGASPGVIAPDTGSARQAVTGASISDQRNEGAVSVNYYGEKATTKLEVGASRENDYKSNFVGGETSIDFNNKNTALNIGSSYTSNDVIPNQLGAITPRVGGTNSNWQFMGGITQIINPTSLAQFAVTYFLDSGFLNDPYKPDYLPNKRIGWSFSGKYLHYISSFHEAGLNLEYRYYTDDWGVKSSTMKTSLRMDLVNGWGLEPGIRYYSQTGTKYYNLLTPPNVTPDSTFIYYTSDYRFASYGQLSGLLEVNKQLSAKNTAYIGGSYGVRNADLRLGGAKVTYPTESEFTKIRMAVVYVGIKGVY